MFPCHAIIVAIDKRIVTPQHMRQSRVHSSVSLRFVAISLIPAIVHSVITIPRLPAALRSPTIVAYIPISFMLSSVIIHLPSLWAACLHPLSRVGVLERIVYYSILQTLTLNALMYTLVEYHNQHQTQPSENQWDILSITALYMGFDFATQIVHWADATNTIAPRTLKGSVCFNWLFYMLFYAPLWSFANWTQSLSLNFVGICFAEFSSFLFYCVNNVCCTRGTAAASRNKSCMVKVSSTSS